MWSIVLMPFHHVALAIVAMAVAIEALLAGRVFVQLAYEDNVDGIAGDRPQPDRPDRSAVP